MLKVERLASLKVGKTVLGKSDQRHRIHPNPNFTTFKLANLTTSPGLIPLQPGNGTLHLRHHAGEAFHSRLGCWHWHVGRYIGLCFPYL